MFKFNVMNLYIYFFKGMKNKASLYISVLLYDKFMQWNIIAIVGRK